MSVQSVARAFSILRCLSAGPLGVSAVAERVELPQSTVSRLLSTLQEVGVVEQVGAGRKYRIGTALLEIAEGALPGRSVQWAARPLLAELVEKIGEAAALSVLEGREVYYLEQIDVDNVVQVQDWTGKHGPAHASAPGLVLLAFADPGVQDKILDHPLEAYTERTMTDPVALRRRLEIIAAEGSEWVYEEFAEGLNSIAAPVRDETGRAIAAVHVHGPSYRFPAPGCAGDVATTVVATADRIAARLEEGLQGVGWPV